MRLFFAMALLVLLTLIAVPKPAQAENPSPEAALALLHAVAQSTANVSSLSATFTQEKKLPVLAKPLVSSGQFCLQRDVKTQQTSADRVLWAYEKPAVSGFAMEDGQAWLWTDTFNARRQAKGTEATALKAVTEHILAWVRVRPDALQKQYTLERLPDEAGQAVLRLRPRGKAAFFTSLEVVFAPSLDSVRQLRFLEKNNESTVLTFEAVRLNEALPPLCQKALRP